MEMFHITAHWFTKITRESALKLTPYVIPRERVTLSHGTSVMRRIWWGGGGTPYMLNGASRYMIVSLLDSIYSSVHVKM